jgi:hypothetical protein
MKKNFVYNDKFNKTYNYFCASILKKMSLEEHIFMARVAEQAERFDDMVSYL